MYGAGIGLSGRGEMIPNEESYCEIDPHVVDQWGIPVLRFHFKWSQDEILQAKHMQETFREIIEAAGGKVTSSSDEKTNWGISRGGEIIHEVGATKMGDDARLGIVRTCL
jgi:choline dehydrogenase-like flavoprotein